MSRTRAATATTALAVVYGPNGTFPLVSRPLPQPSSTQIRVRVHAAALNPLDYKLPSMLPFFLRPLLRGKGIGFDFAGVVDAVGADVRGFSVGERVFGFATSAGSLAEYTLTGVSAVAHLPASIPFAAAASLPGSGLTSLQALHGRLQRGGSLLVFGASGGCGSLGVQFAKALGAGKVVGVCSAANADAVQKLGCDQVVPYDSGDDAALEAALRAAGPFDMAYDCVTSPEDRNYEPLSRTALKPGALHLAINGGTLDWLRFFLGAPREGYMLMMMQPNAAQLAEIAAWVESGTVKPILARQCAFDAAGVEQAFALISSRRAKGKVVLNVVAEET